jgi:hypothetical protein
LSTGRRRGATREILRRDEVSLVVAAPDLGGDEGDRAEHAPARHERHAHRRAQAELRSRSSSSGVSRSPRRAARRLISEKSSGLSRSDDVRHAVRVPPGSGRVLLRELVGELDFPGSTCCDRQAGSSEPSGSTMSIAHQSAKWGTASAATFDEGALVLERRTPAARSPARRKRWSSAEPALALVELGGADRRGGDVREERRGVLLRLGERAACAR